MGTPTSSLNHKTMFILSAFCVVIGQYKCACWPSIASTFVTGAGKKNGKSWACELSEVKYALWDCWMGQMEAACFVCRRQSFSDGGRNAVKLFIPKLPSDSWREPANCFKLLIKTFRLSRRLWSRQWELETKELSALLVIACFRTEKQLIEAWRLMRKR